MRLGPNERTIKLADTVFVKVDVKVLYQQSLRVANFTVICGCEEMQVVFERSVPLSMRLACTQCLSESLAAQGLCDGDHLTATVAPVKIAASLAAFSIWSFNGPVVVWGNPHSGGENYDVEHLLQNVQQIRAADTAFAAIVENGSVDMQEVQDELHDVQEIVATSTAFCALRSDGSVVTWGNREMGGELAPQVRRKLREVCQVKASGGAFAAVLKSLGDGQFLGKLVAVKGRNGSVVTWGHPKYGGDVDSVDSSEQLRPLGADVGLLPARNW
eukprot:s48_g20.t1